MGYDGGGWFALRRMPAYHPARAAWSVGAAGGDAGRRQPGRFSQLLHWAARSAGRRASTPAMCSIWMPGKELPADATLDCLRYT